MTMRLPAAEHAVITTEKLVEYLLNLDHPDGGPKARFLLLAGFSAENPEQFEEALRQQHLTREANPGKPSPFGDKYEIVGPLEGPMGAVMARSVWIIRQGETTPRLITVIPENEL
jgi:hypothetical protein